MNRPAPLAALLLLATLAAAAAPPPRTELGYRHAVAPWRFAFPRDHASHPAFQTEWWYYTGRLAAADGRRFGFELTFFRVGLDPARRASPSAWAPHTLHFAHAALTDVAGRRFLHDHAIARPALGLAGADSTRYRVWIGDWSAELERPSVHRLRAAARGFGLDLTLTEGGPPVIHGHDGVSRKSAGLGEASHYYSLPRLATRGRLTVGGRSVAVAGETWMDHEFGSGRLAAHLAGWDWLGLRLDDGRALMLYLLRDRDGGFDPASSGTLVAADGAARHLPLAGFEVRATAHWTSPHTGARYPSRWSLRVPDAQLALEVEPELDDQELVTAGAAGVVYWEGLVRVRGRSRGAPVAGDGYVELTGYTGRTPGL